MTEEQYQEARETMRKANNWRGMIAAAKEEVSKWTRIEDSHRRELREGKADGAKKLLIKALDRLDVVRSKFAALEFPKEYKKVKRSAASIVAEQTDEEFEMLIESTKR